METNNKPLRQSQQPSQVDGAAYFQGLAELANQTSEQHLGRGTLQNALTHGAEISDRNTTVMQCWYGANIQSALRHDEKDTTDFIMMLFARMLHRMNLNHPWSREADALDDVRDMMAFDPTWTVEDFALCTRLMAKGELGNHYNRPSTAWIRQCQKAYNELKYQAREYIAERAKVKNEAAELEARDPQASKPRTMAEFLSGKNYLSAMDRAEMKANDRQRNG